MAHTSTARNQSQSNKRRKLDDSELDSGDDEGREDRVRDALDEDDDAPERTAVITDITIGRHPGPLPSDGEVCSLSETYHLPLSLSRSSSICYNFPTTLE